MPKHDAPVSTSESESRPPRSELPSISKVDQWLNIMKRKKSALFMREGYVVCVVERVRVEVNLFLNIDVIDNIL